MLDTKIILYVTLGLLAVCMIVLTAVSYTRQWESDHGGKEATSDKMQFVLTVTVMLLVIATVVLSVICSLGKKPEPQSRASTSIMIK